MNICCIITLSLLTLISCQKDLSEYEPEFQPYAKEIQKRVRSIPSDELKEVDALITEHWQKTAPLSCIFCRLEDKYFAPLRDYLTDHPETINRVLERGIRVESNINLLIFKYFIIHYYPDIHQDILRYLDLDGKLIPADEVKTDDDRWHNQKVNYSGDIEVWIEFYLEAT